MVMKSLFKGYNPMNYFRNQETTYDIEFSIENSVVSTVGGNFKIGDIINVTYKRRFSSDKEECCGRLSKIYAHTGDMILVDCSQKYFSDEKLIEISDIIAIDRI